jgi:hypothetical protein
VYCGSRETFYTGFKLTVTIVDMRSEILVRNNPFVWIKDRDGEFTAELKTTLTEHTFATGYMLAQLFLPALQHSSNRGLSPACLGV